MQDRITREKDFFDELVVDRPTTHSLLDRFSEGFYEKGGRGRLWAPIWKSTEVRGAAVLDYCCGDGKFSQHLASLGARVVGIDISPKLIERARASASKMGMNGSSPEFMVGDAHRTPFDNSCFDFVVGNGALHHLDLEKAYAEIARVLKPGGRAMFMEPMYHHPLLWLLRRLTPKIHTTEEKPLSLEDMEMAKKWFQACSHREHFLFAVCFAPVHLLGKRATLAVLGGVDRFDQVLIGIAPQLRRFAWLTMLEMEK